MSSSSDKRGFNLNNLIKEKYDISLSKEEINYIYNMGAKKCEIGDFQNALPIFQFLVLFKPAETLYMKAIAGCLQNLEQYMEAYMYYQSAFMAKMKDNPDCLFYMAFCAIKLQKNDEALNLLNHFLKDNPNHELEKKAKLLLNGLQKVAANPGPVKS